MFKVNNKDTCSGVFILNFERTYFTPCSSVFIVNFEHIIAFWVNKEKRMQCFQNFYSSKSSKPFWDGYRLVIQK